MSKFVALMLAVLATSMSSNAIAKPATAPINLPAAIAELMVPQDLMIAKTAESFDASFKAGMAADPSSADVEKRYPGLTQAASAAARAVVIQQLITNMPGLRTQIADLIANDFDGVEQRQFYDFMASPTGRKIVAMGDKLYNKEKLLAAMPREPTDKLQLSGESFANAYDPGAVAAMDPADLKVMEKFGATAGGAKMVSITPKVQSLVANWVNVTFSAAQPDIQRVVTAEVQSFIAKAGKR